jgi:hypothetical protein
LSVSSTKRNIRGIYVRAVFPACGLEEGEPSAPVSRPEVHAPGREYLLRPPHRRARGVFSVVRNSEMARQSKQDWLHWRGVNRARYWRKLGWVQLKRSRLVGRYFKSGTILSLD